MRILTFTTLYPNAIRPQFGIFVETRLRRLVATGEVEAEVVAPCPWFPSSSSRFGDYASYARMPLREERNGLVIHHPRYPVLPKIGMSLAPALLFAASLPFIKRLIAKGLDFDLIDSHYMYPDGIAAVMLGRALGRPVAITSRGTDLNRIPDFCLPRRQIIWAARRANALITVSHGLRDRLTALGVPANRVQVLHNGVDLELFRPTDRTAIRERLAVQGKLVLSVGNLVPLKGHDLVIKALREIPDTTLLIIGRGPERGALEQTAHAAGVASRTRFLDPVPQQELCELYSAGDALILASSSEGWPNVLLESMACGTPAIASNIPGVDEIITCPDAGIILRERNPQAIAEAVGAIFACTTDRAATRRYAEGFSWTRTTESLVALFDSLNKENLNVRRSSAT